MKHCQRRHLQQLEREFGDQANLIHVTAWLSRITAVHAVPRSQAEVFCRPVLHDILHLDIAFPVAPPISMLITSRGRPGGLRFADIHLWRALPRCQEAKALLSGQLPLAHRSARH